MDSFRCLSGLTYERERKNSEGIQAFCCLVGLTGKFVVTKWQWNPKGNGP